jgi:hypothetical protein
MKARLRASATAIALAISVTGLSACVVPGGDGSVPTGCFREDDGGEDLLVNADRNFTEFSSTNGTCSGTEITSGYMFYWSLKPVNADQVLQKRLEICEPRGYSQVWPEGIYYNEAHAAFDYVWACL